MSSLIQQNGFLLNSNFFINIYDNSNTPELSQVLSEFPGISLTTNEYNLGFSKAHNTGISFALANNADYVLILNPDVYLENNALKTLLDVALFDPCAGILGPKLYRADKDLNPIMPLRFDTTGIYITPQIRHLDRGSEIEDHGCYQRDEYVFGISGACMLLTRKFILDASLPSCLDHNNENYIQLFDDAFFAYREDADLSWRALALGWRCRYVSSAVGYHTRKVLPERRKNLPSELNAYSVRNRFLLQFNNWTLSDNFIHLPQTIFRNILIILAVLCIEYKSISGLIESFKLLPRSFKIRKFIKQKRRVPLSLISSYFKSSPYSTPALENIACSTTDNTLSAIIINYNSGARLKKAVEALYTSKEILKNEINLQIIVVDNGSTDNSLNGLPENYSLNIIKNKNNLGFSAALNQGARSSSASNILIMNPDVIINHDCIKGLVEALNNYRNISGVSPILKDFHNNIQYHYLLRGLPTLGSTICNLFYIDRIFPNNPWTIKYNLEQQAIYVKSISDNKLDSNTPYFRKDTPIIMPQPAAACFLVRSSTFNELKGFNESFYPAWYEDVDFATRARNSCFNFAIMPNIYAIHEGGYSEHRISKYDFLSAYYSNMLRYWKLHGKPIEYVIIRLAVPASLLFKCLVLKIKITTSYKLTRISKAKLYMQSKVLFKAFYSLSFTKRL